MADLLCHGYIRRIRMRDGYTWADGRQSPPKGKRWFILGGNVKHLMGTNTHLIVRIDKIPVILATLLADSENMVFNTNIDDTEDSGVYPLFNGVAEAYQAQYRIVPVLSEWQIWFTGDATATCSLFILEVDE